MLNCEKKIETAMFPKIYYFMAMPVDDFISAQELQMPTAR